MGDPARIQPLSRSATRDDQVQVDPPLAQHGLRQLRAPSFNLGQTTRRHGHGGRPRRPRPSQRCVCRPHRHTRDLIPAGHSGRRNARTPRAEHWTPERSDARTGHRSRGQAPVGHRTLAPDTGHRTPDAGHGRGHGDDSTAGIRASLAATPSDRTLRRAPCLCSRTTSRLLGRFAGPAAPRRIALLRRFRVERRANGEASSVIASSV